MYHIQCKFPNGHVARVEAHQKHNATAVFEQAVKGFSHARLLWVAVCDHSGPVRIVSHSGQVYL